MDKAMNWFKDLRSDPRPIFSWLWDQRLLLLISLVLISPFLVHSLPPQESWFIWQQWIGMAGLLLHLFPLFLSIMLESILSILYISLPFFDYSIILFFIWDFALLYLIRRGWRRSGKEKGPIFTALFGFGIVHVALFVAFAPFGSVGPIHSSCEIYTSEMDGVRVVAYPENKLLGNDHLFYLRTNNGGKTWKQVGYEIEGNPHSIDEEDCLEYLQENP